MRKFLFCFIFLLTISNANAQTKELPADATQTLPVDPSQTANPASGTIDESVPQPEPIVVEPPKLFTTRVLRGLSRGTASLHLSPFSTWIPMKYGISGGYVFNENWTLEGEYTQATMSASFQHVDFGHMVDRRYGLQSRWYPGSSNSFNFILGFYKSEFVAEIGNTVLNNVGNIPGADVLRFESYGPQVGLSNRWQWQPGVTFGVDWFVMYFPLFGRTDDSALKYINNSTDRSNLEDVVSVLKNIPQFDVLKLNLGYSF